MVVAGDPVGVVVRVARRAGVVDQDVKARVAGLRSAGVSSISPSRRERSSPSSAVLVVWVVLVVPVVRVAWLAPVPLAVLARRRLVEVVPSLRSARSSSASTVLAALVEPVRRRLAREARLVRAVRALAAARTLVGRTSRLRLVRLGEAGAPLVRLAGLLAWRVQPRPHRETLAVTACSTSSTQTERLWLEARLVARPTAAEAAGLVVAVAGSAIPIPIPQERSRLTPAQETVALVAPGMPSRPEVSEARRPSPRRVCLALAVVVEAAEAVVAVVLAPEAPAEPAATVVTGRTAWLSSSTRSARRGLPLAALRR